MKKSFILLTLVTSALFGIISCNKEPGTSNPPPNSTVCDNVPKTWSADVSTIIAQSCATAGCHAAGSNNGPGALTTYAEVFAARTNIKSAVQSGAMPRNSTLSNNQKNSIICWIESGAPNN